MIKADEAADAGSLPADAGSPSADAGSPSLEGAAASGDRRLAALRTSFRRAGLEGLLVVHPPNIRYLSGFTGSSALLLVLGEEPHALVTDFRYEEQVADQLSPEVSVWIARDGLLNELGSRLETARAPQRIGFESGHLTVRDRKELGERCGRVLWEEAPPILEEMRARKDPWELAQLRRAVEVAEAALARTLEALEEGMAEREVAGELDYALRAAGSGPPPFPCIVASGARSSLPHAEPGERRLQEGDLLLIDFGATVAGYCSDLTRTFVLGAARPWQRHMHEAVLEAQEVAVSAMAPEVAAREVDAAARRSLEAGGLAERFGHSTGHGLGLEVHENPRLSRRSNDILRIGNVVTVEPGVYLPGRGGVRIEDDVAVSTEGARLLSGFRRDLIEL